MKSRSADRNLAKIRRMLNHTEIITEFFTIESLNGKMLSGIPLRREYLYAVLVNANILALSLKNIERLLSIEEEKKK